MQLSPAFDIGQGGAFVRPEYPGGHAVEVRTERPFLDIDPDRRTRGKADQPVCAAMADVEAVRNPRSVQLRKRLAVAGRPEGKPVVRTLEAFAKMVSKRGTAQGEFAPGRTAAKRSYGLST